MGLILNSVGVTVLKNTTTVDFPRIEALTVHIYNADNSYNRLTMLAGLTARGLQIELLTAYLNVYLQYNNEHLYVVLGETM